MYMCVCVCVCAIKITQKFECLYIPIIFIFTQVAREQASDDGSDHLPNRLDIPDTDEL